MGCHTFWQLKFVFYLCGGAAQYAWHKRGLYKKLNEGICIM